MAKLKVYSGSLDGRNRHFVAATSQKEALGALILAGHYITLHQLRGWWTVTSNEEDISVATAKPGAVFMRGGLARSGPAIEVVRKG